jgi:hypothetical protein
MRRARPSCVNDRAIRCKHFANSLTTPGLQFCEPFSSRRARFVAVGAAIGKQSFHFTINCRALRSQRSRLPSKAAQRASSFVSEGVSAAMMKGGRLGKSFNDLL